MKNCRQFRLLTWTSFIGQLVHPIGGIGGGGDRIFRQLQVFIIEHNYLVQDKSNNKSIYVTYHFK